MSHKLLHYSLVSVCFLSLISCSHYRTAKTIPTASESLPICHIVYDAGSSGTRLYIYENKGGDWIEHEGPKSAALADPVRGTRGKTLRDIDGVVTELTSSLDTIQYDGPTGSSGQPKWKSFNWKKQCNIISVNVYATGGMRIAEQENIRESAQLWEKLRQNLVAIFSSSVAINTRTISGYEEGLYTWLAVGKKRDNNRFGIVEMGGASSQITFPCPRCGETDNAVKIILIDDKPLRIYSYSFLGLGQDEAPKTWGIKPNCTYGIGRDQPTWQPYLCNEQIALNDSRGTRDPYNFSHHRRGSHNRVPTHLADSEKWFLTGSFIYSNDNDITTCCFNRGKCHSETTSCFRAIYLKKYLDALGVSSHSEKVNDNWTQGVAICKENNCLQKAGAPVCRWLDSGCL